MTLVDAPLCAHASHLGQRTPSQSALKAIASRITSYSRLTPFSPPNDGGEPASSLAEQAYKRQEVGKTTVEPSERAGQDVGGSENDGAGPLENRVWASERGSPWLRLRNAGVCLSPF
jgi:hypothetical protein